MASGSSAKDYASLSAAQKTSSNLIFQYVAQYNTLSTKGSSEEYTAFLATIKNA